MVLTPWGRSCLTLCQCSTMWCFDSGDEGAEEVLVQQVALEELLEGDSEPDADSSAKIRSGSAQFYFWRPFSIHP